MAALKYIMLHCTATPEGREVSSADIRRWHTAPVKEGGRGWKQVGYTHLIHLDGKVEQLVSNNGNDVVDPWEVTNGAAGYNNVTLHIVYAGGLAKNRPAGMTQFPPKDTRTKEQLKAMETLVIELLTKHRKAILLGHNDVANKACPSFKVRDWALSIGIDKTRLF